MIAAESDFSSPSMVENGNVMSEKPPTNTQSSARIDNDPQVEASQAATIKAQKKPFKFKVTILMLCLISVVVAMDSVIVAASLPAMTVALKGNTVEASWVGTSYLLAQTVRLPFTCLLPLSYKSPQLTANS
jgi:hypothetical protein